MRYIMNDSTAYDKEIQIISRWLCGGDYFLAEELRSEMHIAILNMEEGLDRALCIRMAKCRAIDYLRSRAMNYSYAGAFQHISLQVMEDVGFQIDTDGNVYAPGVLSTDMEDPESPDDFGDSDDSE
jgi:hypothetical protein